MGLERERKKIRKGESNGTVFFTGRPALHREQNHLPSGI